MSHNSSDPDSEDQGLIMAGKIVSYNLKGNVSSSYSKFHRKDQFSFFYFTNSFCKDVPPTHDIRELKEINTVEAENELCFSTRR